MSEVKVTLSAKDEIALLDRFGRRCNRETLIKRAVAEVLRMQAVGVPVYYVPPETPLYPYCETCAIRCPASHSDNNEKAIEYFLAQHPSPAHVVNPKWEGEVKPIDEEYQPYPPEVASILFRFNAGEKFLDLEGREISAMMFSQGKDTKPLIVHYEGDNSESFYLGLDEIKPAVICICGRDGKLVSSDCPVPAHAADARLAQSEIPESPKEAELDSAARTLATDLPEEPQAGAEFTSEDFNA